MHFLKYVTRLIVFVVVAQATAASAISTGGPPGASLSGGVGAEERQTMHAARASYNLRLTFATIGSGEYLAGIPVQIDSVKRPGISRVYEDSGPLLYLQLDPGTYRISASYDGQAQVRRVHLGKGAVEQVFYWPASSSELATTAAIRKTRHPHKIRIE
ncbi:MAG: hypothetical protein V4573_14135 [Pseudomonadota bacterium]